MALVKRPRKDITTQPDTASQATQSADAGMEPASVKVASVGGLVRAKVKAVSAWSAGRSGGSRGSHTSEESHE